MNNDEFQKKLFDTFKIEAAEHISTITNGLLQIEKEDKPARLKLAETLHREMHSLKGAARAVNLLEIEGVCQRVEEIFSAWKHDEAEIDVKCFDILHRILELLHHYLFNEPDKNFNFNSESEELIKKITHTNDHPQSTVPVTVQRNKEQSISYSDHSLQAIRISGNKLDQMLLKIEELLIGKLITKSHVDELNQLTAIIKSLKNDDNHLKFKKIENILLKLNDQFNKDAYHLNSLIDNALSDAKKMMTMPFSMILNSFPGMIRNLCREKNKEVNFILQGDDIEIDRRILDELKDPLIHLVRNSVDHGIEYFSQRGGKPAQGTVKIAISKIGEQDVDIIITDDGQGIDIEAVKQSAITKGYLAENEANTLEDSELLSLIYLSGLSTTRVATDISGQGLGMAIVKEKIDKIGGRITLNNHPGRGVEIKLTIPVTLASYKGVFVRVCEQLFVVPTMYLERIIRVQISDIKTVLGKNIISFSGQSIPLVKLHEILQMTNTRTEEASIISVFIICLNEKRMAFQVDEVQGEAEVLVKKLNKPLLRVQFVSGVTVLGNGIPVPILSTLDLMKAASTHTVIPVELSNEISDPIVPKTILVVEDSITTRILLKNILEMENYHVMTAVDGADAWRILNENTISLVMSDIEMPNMNGFELTARIREDEHLKDLPVILLTSCEKKSDKEHGLDVGANAYILKSQFDNTHLISVINRMVSV